MSKQRQLLNLLQENMTTVRVEFLTGVASNKKYTYKVPLNWNVQKDDALVVDSPSGLAIVQVVSVDKSPQFDVESDLVYKWAVGKVDRTAYDAQVAREALFLEQLQGVERLSQRDAMLTKARAVLGTDTEASKAFDEAVKALNS